MKQKQKNAEDAFLMHSCQVRKAIKNTAHIKVTQLVYHCNNRCKSDFLMKTSSDSYIYTVSHLGSRVLLNSTLHWSSMIVLHLQTQNEWRWTMFDNCITKRSPIKSPVCATSCSPLKINVYTHTHTRDL